MPSDTLETIRTALEEAGIEIYQELSDRLVIAERIRVHIMDSGVWVSADPLTIGLSIKAQLSDFPNDEADAQFDRVRASSIASQLAQQQFVEVGTKRHSVLDPVDDEKVLDVWFELSFEKTSSVANIVEDLKWSLSLDKTLSS